MDRMTAAAYNAKPKKKKRVDREGPIQEAVVTYLRDQLPDAIVHHSRNEINKRGVHIAKEIAKATRRGAVKGFPDIIVLPYATLPAMLFEVKAEGNYADPTQKAVHARLSDLGYRVAVVRSTDDVRDTLLEWNIPVRGVIGE